jgi:hypothetical protein
MMESTFENDLLLIFGSFLDTTSLKITPTRRLERPATKYLVTKSHIPEERTPRIWFMLMKTEIS